MSVEPGTINQPLEQLKGLRFSEFLGRYSSQGLSPDQILGVVYHVTTEPTYVGNLHELSVKGGIHLAVAGGLDPALAQIARTEPDLTVLCDINLLATHVVHQRLRLLESAETGKEYWEMFASLLQEDPRIKFNSLDLPVTGGDVQLGGWSSDQYYPAVRLAWKKGSVKFIHSDISSDGLITGMNISRDLSIPIRLIHLSNIFDYPANWPNRKIFKQVLAEGLRSGVIDPNAQIVMASIYNGMDIEVLSVEQYLQRQ